MLCGMRCFVFVEGVISGRSVFVNRVVIGKMVVGIEFWKNGLMLN